MEELKFEEMEKMVEEIKRDAEYQCDTGRLKIAQVLNYLLQSMKR